MVSTGKNWKQAGRTNSCKAMKGVLDGTVSKDSY